MFFLERKWLPWRLLFRRSCSWPRQGPPIQPVPEGGSPGCPGWERRSLWPRVPTPYRLDRQSLNIWKPILWTVSRDTSDPEICLLRLFPVLLQICWPVVWATCYTGTIWQNSTLLELQYALWSVLFGLRFYFRYSGHFNSTLISFRRRFVFFFFTRN